MSAAQHQRIMDDAGALEAEAERLEKECREALANMDRWDYPEQIRPWAVHWQHVDAEDVLDALDDMSRDELCKALSVMDSDPLEAVRILRESRDRAIRDVVGRMDFESIAKAQSDDEEDVA